MPAVIATAPSIVIQPSESQDSRRDPAGELLVALAGDRRGGARRAAAERRESAVRPDSCARPLGRHRRDQRSPTLGQLVHDHLPVALGASETGALELAGMMGDEPLVAADDPGQVADAGWLPASRASAMASRVGSPSAFALAAQSSSSSVAGSPLRTRSALGRSRQRRSQVSGFAAMRPFYKHSYKCANVSVMSERYVPALRFSVLTRIYDPAIRLTTRERTLRTACCASSRRGQVSESLTSGAAPGRLRSTRSRSAATRPSPAWTETLRSLGGLESKAAEAGVNVRFDHGRSTSLPYDEDSFDVVLSTLFFHHLTGAEKQETGRRSRGC